MKKPKAVRLLEILLAGGKIEYNDFEFKIGEFVSTDGKQRTYKDICVVGYECNMKDGKLERTDKEHLMAPGMSMAGFLSMAEQIPEDTLFIKGAEKVLTELRRKKR